MVGGQMHAFVRRGVKGNMRRGSLLDQYQILLRAWTISPLSFGPDAFTVFQI